MRRKPPRRISRQQNSRQTLALTEEMAAGLVDLAANGRNHSIAVVVLDTVGRRSRRLRGEVGGTTGLADACKREAIGNARMSYVQVTTASTIQER